MKKLVALAFVLSSLMAVSPASAQMLDNFENGINPLLWSIDASSGPQVAGTNQRVEVYMPADSSGDPYAKLNGRCALRGDFDIQVDFDLLEFPYQNGVRVGLWAGNAASAGLVQRESSFYAVDDSYYLFDNGVTVTYVPTSDMSGKLRLVRQGNTITGYSWDPILSTWSRISDGTITGDYVGYALVVFSLDAEFSVDVRVAYDNFRINSGTVVCHEPDGQLTGLESMVDYFVAFGGVEPEVETALRSKVSAALNALAVGNPNAAKVAMNDLKALVRFVEAQTGQQITAEAAQAIIRQANTVIDTIIAVYGG